MTFRAESIPELRYPEHDAAEHHRLMTFTDEQAEAGLQRFAKILGVTPDHITMTKDMDNHGAVRLSFMVK